MHYLLAAAAPSVSPEFMGMLVIALMQLSQLVFAYRKDQARVESVKKEDLAALRKELKAEIAEVATKAEKVREGLSGELKSMSHDSEVARGELHEKINNVAIDTATASKGLQIIEQTTAAMSHKLDMLLSRTRRS